MFKYLIKVGHRICLHEFDNDDAAIVEIVKLAGNEQYPDRYLYKEPEGGTGEWPTLACRVDGEMFIEGRAA